MISSLSLDGASKLHSLEVQSLSQHEHVLARKGIGNPKLLVFPRQASGEVLKQLMGRATLK